jgi:hypothetical protein
MHWNGMWDNLQQYNKFFLKNLFLNSILSNFFNFYLTMNYFFFSNFFKKNALNSRKKKMNKILNINHYKYRTNNNNYIKFLKKSFSGRVWVFFFNTWCVTSIFIYTSKFKIKKLKMQKKKEIINTLFFKFLFLKNNFQFFYKNNFFKKITF